jgi:hypothetical protein
VDNGSTAQNASIPASGEALPTMRQAMRVLAQQALSRAEGDEAAAATLLDIDVEELQGLLLDGPIASDASSDNSDVSTTGKTTAKRSAGKRR